MFCWAGLVHKPSSICISGVSLFVQWLPPQSVIWLTLGMEGVSEMEFLFWLSERWGSDFLQVLHLPELSTGEKCSNDSVQRKFLLKVQFPKRTLLQGNVHKGSTTKIRTALLCGTCSVCHGLLR